MDYVRLKLLLFSILILLGLAGCTTDVSPPSGPVETEVCFHPAPPTSWDSGGTCGWFIELQLDETTLSYDYTYDRCFTIPSRFSPGDEILVEVTGDWSQPGFKCELYKLEVPSLLYLYQYHGTFLVTE